MSDVGGVEEGEKLTLLLEDEKPDIGVVSVDGRASEVVGVGKDTGGPITSVVVSLADSTDDAAEPLELVVGDGEIVIKVVRTVVTVPVTSEVNVAMTIAGEDDMDVQYRESAKGELNCSSKLRGFRSQKVRKAPL